MNELEKRRRQLEMAIANGDKEAEAYFREKLAVAQQGGNEDLVKAQRQLAMAQEKQDAEASAYFSDKLRKLSADANEEERVSNLQGLDKTVAFGDAALSTATNVAADTAELLLRSAQGNPVGRGLVKLLSGDSPFAELTDEEEAAIPKAISNTLRMDTFTPEGQKIKEYISRELSDVAETLGIDEVAKYMSDKTNEFEQYIQNEYGVSKTAAQAITAFPQLVLEIAPFTKAGKVRAKVGKKFGGTEADYIDNFVETPDMLEGMRSARNTIYEDLKGRGAQLKKGTINKVIREVERGLQADGFDLKRTGLQGALAGRKARLSGKLAVDTEIVDRGRFRGFRNPESLRGERYNSQKTIELARKPKDEHFIDVENLKQDIFAKIDRRDPQSMAAAARASRIIDAFLDRQLQSYVAPDIDGSVRDVQKSIRAARDIGGRVRRAEDLNDIWYNASLADTAAGQMNSLRTGLRNILKDKNQRKFYRPEEIRLMEQISRNAIPDDASMLRMVSGMAGKAVPPLARFIRSYYGGKFREMPFVSRANYFSDSLLKNTERTGDAFVALQRRVLASKDANEAAIRYLREVPKGKRDANELGLILANGNFDLNVPIERASKLKKEAFQIARGKQIVDGILRTSLIGNEEDENEPVY